MTEDDNVVLYPPATSEDAKRQVTSIYLQDEIERVVAGIRYDSFEIDVLNALGEQRRKEDSETSPRFGLIFKPKTCLSMPATQSFLPTSGGRTQV